MNTLKYKLAVGAFSLITLAVPLSQVHAATTTPVTTTTAHTALTAAQKTAILNLLKAFGATPDVIAKVTAALNKNG